MNIEYYQNKLSKINENKVEYEKLIESIENDNEIKLESIECDLLLNEIKNKIIKIDRIFKIHILNKDIHIDCTEIIDKISEAIKDDDHLIMFENILKCFDIININKIEDLLKKDINSYESCEISEIQIVNEKRKKF